MTDLCLSCTWHKIDSLIFQKFFPTNPLVSSEWERAAIESHVLLPSEIFLYLALHYSTCVKHARQRIRRRMLSCVVLLRCECSFALLKHHAADTTCDGLFTYLLPMWNRCNRRHQKGCRQSLPRKSCWPGNRRKSEDDATGLPAKLY